jgi:hypothetical protein
LAAKSAENLAKRSVTDSISQAELKPSTGAALRIASLAKFEPPLGRWDLIVPGVITMFAILIGALWTCPALVERHWVIRHWFFRTEPGL